MADLRTRLDEAEAVIRAQARLVVAMYEHQLSRHWPAEAGDLLRAYQGRYGVTLDDGSCGGTNCGCHVASGRD